ncbi:MAG: hypothetical protein JHD15_18870 [Phenylobacterium sp.]|uniref:hypothetical protein n=1 Tax=Phenylobacterium sp. TaxID=1871053 RepID=UPI001A233AC6|nr:hypothetical protein [Phenylobacterium sp.]MBJ7412402.1 hypothetical protein [Phenylobacterium sp.]
MSKSIFAALAAAGLSLALAGPAAAQSGFLKNLARQAAAAAIQNAAQPQQPAASAEGEAPGQADAQPAQDAETAPAAQTPGPAPWPVNVGARSVKYPSDLDFSPELEAQKKAFVEFSKVSCNDCEGGYSYDAWVRHFIRLDGSYGAWEKKVGGLALGEAITWKGSASTGSITVVSEEPVNGWSCKQLKWELKKAQSKAERPGLFCNGKASSYAGSDSWVEVF